MKNIDKLIHLTDPTRAEFFELNDKYYLIVKPTYFFKFMRLGDQVILTTLLYNIKRILISKISKLTQDNFYFMYNDERGKTLVDVVDLMKYAPHVWYPDVVSLPKPTRIKNNISQVQKKIHHQRVPMLYRRFRLTLSPNEYPCVPLIPQGIKQFNRQRTNIMILPNKGKDYNIERNQTEEMLVTMIKSISDDYDKIYIISKDNYEQDIPRLKRLTKNNNIVSVGTVYSQAEIVDLCTQTCHTYIGGDCGFSHLIANMYNAPMRLVYFFRTRTTLDHTHAVRFKECVIDRPKHLKQLVGVDDVKYIDQKAYSLYNSEVIIQSNQDGELYRKGYTQRIQPIG